MVKSTTTYCGAFFMRFCAFCRMNFCYTQKNVFLEQGKVYLSILFLVSVF